MSAALRPLFAYWVAACGGKPIPARADVDPVDMPRELLPNIVLVDVSTDPLRFRYRVMGSKVARMLGEDWTGRYVDEIPYIHASVHEQYAATASSGKPSINFNSYELYDPTTLQRKAVSFERLILPLSGNGVEVSMLLGGTLETDLSGHGTGLSAW